MLSIPGIVATVRPGRTTIDSVCPVCAIPKGFENEDGFICGDNGAGVVC